MSTTGDNKNKKKDDTSKTKKTTNTSNIVQDETKTEDPTSEEVNTTTSIDEGSTYLKEIFYGIIAIVIFIFISFVLFKISSFDKKIKYGKTEHTKLVQIVSDNNKSIASINSKLNANNTTQDKLVIKVDSNEKILSGKASTSELNNAVDGINKKISNTNELVTSINTKLSYKIKDTNTRQEIIKSNVSNLFTDTSNLRSEIITNKNSIKAYDKLSRESDTKIQKRISYMLEKQKNVSIRERKIIVDKVNNQTTSKQTKQKKGIHYAKKVKVIYGKTYKPGNIVKVEYIK